MDERAILENKISHEKVLTVKEDELTGDSGNRQDKDADFNCNKSGANTARAKQNIIDYED